MMEKHNIVKGGTGIGLSSADFETIIIHNIFHPAGRNATASDATGPGRGGRELG